KRPLLRSFGADGLKLLRSTLDQYGEQEEAGIAELETFFDSIAVRSRVRVAGLAFRTAKGIKAILIAPAVHPGPMGFVSGSDLPSKIARGLTDLTPNVLVAHGPTTHDENPATSAEVKKVSEAVREMVGSATFGPTAGRACRVKYARASALAQAFGDDVLIVASFAPNPTDDIDSATGHAAVQEARLVGARDAIFVDGNNMVPGIRDEIRLRLAGLVQECEAMTTDNHSVNLSMDGFNAIGAALDRQTIVAQAEGTVREAIANLEAAEVAAFAGEIANF